MAEYIEREAVLRAVRGLRGPRRSPAQNQMLDDLIAAVIHILAVDVEVATRCKDCRSCRELNRKDRVEDAYAEGVLWCMNQSNGVWPDDFCSYGEPKEGAYADHHN